MKLQYEKSAEETEGLRKQLETTAGRLEVLEKEEARREQSKQDLRALEETMVKEFSTLATLRRLFVHDLKNRVKKASAYTFLLSLVCITLHIRRSTAALLLTIWSSW